MSSGQDGSWAPLRRVLKNMEAARPAMTAVAVLTALGVVSAFQTTNRTFTSADNGHRVSLATGEVFVVSLTANPSTGFAWYVAGDSMSGVKRLDQHQAEPTQPGLGRPSLQVMRFQAPAAAATGTLRLEYKRAWETTVAPASTYSLTLSVQAHSVDAAGTMATDPPHAR